MNKQVFKNSIFLMKMQISSRQQGFDGHVCTLFSFIIFWQTIRWLISIINSDNKFVELARDHHLTSEVLFDPFGSGKG